MLPVTFETSTIAVAQIFAMGAMGFYLVRAGHIQEAGLRLLSFLSVNVFFPLFIFVQIIRHFDPVHMPFWWNFPLINISLILVGLSVSSIIVARHRHPVKDAFLSVSALHNAGYIPLLMTMSLAQGPGAGEIYACVIISIIGFDTCLWSLGVWLLTRGKSGRIDFKKMINPPLISMFTAIMFVLILGPGKVPEMVLKPIGILGDAAMAVAMIVIGGNLSLASLHQVKWPQVAGATLIKLLVMPMVTLLVLSVLKLNPLISFVAILQSTMPSSVTLSIIGRNYESKDQDFINQTIFVTHLASMITIPIFLGIYGKLM